MVYVPPEEIYDLLVDFPRYADYSKHITEVRREGDGSPGTEYDIAFSWWKLSYTARSKVTDVDPPERIDWELIKDINARGYWRIEHIPEEAPDGKPDACRIRLRIEFNPESANENAINLPTFVGLDWVIDQVKPKIKTEAERIVRRVVADLEGEKREVELTIHNKPSST